MKLLRKTKKDVTYITENKYFWKTVELYFTEKTLKENMNENRFQSKCNVFIFSKQNYVRDLNLFGYVDKFFWKLILFQWRHIDCSMASLWCYYVDRMTTFATKVFFTKLFFAILKQYCIRNIYVYIYENMSRIVTSHNIGLSLHAKNIKRSADKFCY